MIIGFGHKAQSGKDTAGEYLVKYYGFKRMSYGDKLKEVASVLTGIPIEEFYGEYKNKFNKTWNKTHREILQHLGTDAIREQFDIDAWVKSTLTNLDSDNNYVVTDVRFPNEVEGIKDLGGKVVKVIRGTGNYPIDNYHPSEVALNNYNNWDHIINNNGTLNQYYKALDSMMKEHFWWIKKRGNVEIFFKHTLPSRVKTLWKHAKRIWKP